MRNPGRVIGFAGRLQSGKSTAARWLESRHGFQRVGVADALYHEVRTRFRRTLLEIAEEYSAAIYAMGPRSDEDAIEWLLTQKPPIVRALLQEYGTEVRRADDPNYWVEQWVKRAKWGRDIVNENVRFPNEARVIRNWYNGIVVWIERPDLPATEGDAHVSERAFGPADCDRIVVNDGTCEAFYAKLDDLVAAPPTPSQVGHRRVDVAGRARDDQGVSLVRDGGGVSRGVEAAGPRLDWDLYV